MKTIASIDEIRIEIQRRIRASQRANGYCAGCEAPLPSRIVHDGVAKWIAPVATAKRGCEGFLLEIVAAVRQDYDLPVQSLSETIRDLMSTRKPLF